MSSPIPRSGDEAREDEIDLGDEDGELTRTTNGEFEHDVPSIPDEPGREETDGHLLTPRRAPTSHLDNNNPDSTALSLPGVDESTRPLSLRSLEDSASLPDDTPSLHGSLPSSPTSSAFAFRGSPRNTPSPAHRPFDLRFQSRLSSGSVSSPFRPSSPFLTHSRHSSIASRTLSPAGELDIDEPPQSPWEVVRWTKLRKASAQIFSEAGKRNFGRPTCLTVSTVIVVGTSKGIILVFDYQQNLKTIIGPGTKAVECGAIASLAISADYSTVAGGHALGDIFTWEIPRPARPFLHISAVPNSQREARHSDGHVAGVSVIHVGFLGTRRTALVSADDRGMAFSHLATRGMGAVGRTVKTTRILGRYPEIEAPSSRPRKPSSVLGFSPLPLGNTDQPTDSLGLVAMLTPYLLVIVSTTPVAQTQYKSPRPKEVISHSVLTAALSWFPSIKLKGKDDVSKTKLVYCWSNILTILEISIADGDSDRKDRPPILEFKPRNRWRSKEAIVAVQWLSRSVLAVLTITQQLHILEDPSLRVTDSFDLLHRHIYHADLFSSQLRSIVEQYDETDTSMHGVVGDAFYLSFRTYKGRIFFLGHNDISVGSLSNWADRLLAYMEAGDFVAAIRLATSYYSGDAEKLTIGLPEENESRHAIVREKLLEMISASLKYAFGRNTEANTGRLEKPQLEALADASIKACICSQEFDFLWDEVYVWYEDHDSQDIFLDILEPFIVDREVTSLPPSAIKALINHYSTTHTSSALEEIICFLDTTTMDIEQVTTLCKQHNLYDAFIYVWTRTLFDYVSPLEELLNLAQKASRRSFANGDDGANAAHDFNNAMKMYPYLSFILTGRVYPTGEEMADSDATVAKSVLYTYLFSGTPSTEADSFSALRVALKLDPSSFMSMLNEAFEDSFLNNTDDSSSGEEGDLYRTKAPKRLRVNRQFLVSILLEVMNELSFTPLETIYLDMFIARNLPKYIQYILLSGSALHQILEHLCHYPLEEMAGDCELSAEYLLSVYHPPDIQSLIPLFKGARFYRILKSTYRAEKQIPELILVYLEDLSERELVFECIYDCLQPGSGLSAKQRLEVTEVIKLHAAELAEINVSKAAETVQARVPALHESFVQALKEEEYRQYQYLETIFEPQETPLNGHRASNELSGWLVERYVQLLCKYNPSHVSDFVETLHVGSIRLNEVLPSMEESGVIDGAVILLARQGQVREAMDRLISQLKTLETGLVEVIHNSQDAPDPASTSEAVDHLVALLEKYAKVGTWLCQSQTNTKMLRKAHRNTAGANKQGASVIMHQPLSFEEALWLDLLDSIVRIARNVSSMLSESRQSQENGTDVKDHQPLVSADSKMNDYEATSSMRRLVQQSFTALLASTSGSPSGQITPHEPRSDLSFLRILRAFLTRAASWSPSLSELRSVLASIFSAYTYEESLLSLANDMLDKDLFVHVDEVARLRQHGWRPRGQVCEICRRRLWGPGAGIMIWDAWEDKQKPTRPTPDEGPSCEGKGKSVVTVPSESSRMQHLPQMSRKADKSKKEKNMVRETSENETFDSPFSSSSLRTNNDKGKRDINSSKTTLQQGPIVIFACRHLYHRSCLLHAAGVSESTDHASLSASLPPFPHRFHQALSHRSDSDQQRELVCLLCFAVHN